MVMRVCNRCNGKFRGTKGGELKLSGTNPRVFAHLCPICYVDMVSEYYEGGPDA